jgi:hypothetical protein
MPITDPLRKAMSSAAGVPPVRAACVARALDRVGRFHAQVAGGHRAGCPSQVGQGSAQAQKLAQDHSDSNREDYDEAILAMQKDHGSLVNLLRNPAHALAALVVPTHRSICPQSEADARNSQQRYHILRQHLSPLVSFDRIMDHTGDDQVKTPRELLVGSSLIPVADIVEPPPCRRVH